MDTGALALAAFILTAIGWISREIWRWRKAKRLAAEDATKTLHQKKALLEEMLSKAEDVNDKNNLIAQRDEVNAALLGLHAQRLRHTLKEAGLPAEEILTADGHRQLQSQQIAQLKEEIAEVKNLPQSDSIWDLLAQASAYYYAELYQYAKETYDRILKLSPSNPIALASRGITYAMLKRYDEAFADFNRSLELRPDDPDTINNQGTIYQRLGRYNEALDSFDHAIRLRPDYPEALHNRGRVYIEFERYTEALIDLNRSLELSPDHPTFLHNRGTTYAHMKRYDEAFADFNRSLELRPDDADTLYNLACLFSQWGKTDDALAYLEKAIKGDEKYREDAKTDKDFDNIKDDPRFKKLMESD